MTEPGPSSTAQRATSAPLTWIIVFPTFAALYAICALLSRWISTGPDGLATFWIPSGLYLAAVVRSDPAVWPALVAGALLGSVVGDALLGSREVSVALSFALVSTAEALAGALLLRRLGGVPHLGRIAYVLRFVAVAAIVPLVPGGLLAALVEGTRDSGATFFESLRIWWIADVVAVLVIAPPFLTPRRAWQQTIRGLRGWRGVEAILAQATVILVVWAVYWHPRNPFRPSFYLLPCLLWVTFRFGSQGIMLALVSTAILTVRGTLYGLGPLADFADSGQAPLAVHMFVGVGAVCFLCFAAALEEREESVAELRARDQDARVRLFADTAPAILWASDREGQLTFLSRGWYELTGLSDGSGLGAGWLDAIHPDDRDRAGDQITAAIGRRLAFQHRYRVRAANDSFRWVMSAGRPQRDERGEMVGFVGSIIDVHDYTTAANALARADALLDAVFQGAPVGLAFLDRDLRFQRINERLAIINGLPIAAHIGHTPPELLPGIENMPQIMEDFRHILNTGLPRLGVQVKGETPATPGVQHEWREYFFPVSVAGQVVGLGVVAEDVTEQKRIEAALRASEARFRTLAEAGPVIVWVTEADGIQYLSPRWTEFTGLSTSPDYAIDAALEPVHPDDRASARREWFESEAGTVFETELRLRHHGGEYRWFLSRGVAIAGDHVQRVGAYVDIHDRKVAERELLEAGRRKDEFLAMLAHELRNPLAPIQNAVHILKIAESGSAAQASAREIIGRQLTHIVRLVDDLLDVSRLSRGKLSIKREPTDLAAIVRDTATDLSRSFEQRGIRFEVSVPPDQVWVDGDRTRLAQVVGNLLHNAQKFTPSGGLVRLSLVADVSGGPVHVHVLDTGVGMTEELRSRVFDEFSQGTQSLDRGAGGLGLGLALVKRFAQLHGGDAEARSAGLGLGSEFIVHLPARVARDSAEVAPAADNARV